MDMNTKMAAISLEKETMTGPELYEMGDIGPAELVKGEIVELMPTGHPHGYIEAIIAALLVMFVRKQKSGRVLTGEVGVYTERNPDTVRGMDVAFISNERLSQVKSKSYLDVAPELVVEVMSPDDRWSSVQEKLAEYFAIGVKLIWVIDPRLEQVHVYRSLTEVERLTSDDNLTGGEVLPSFEVTVAELFAG